MQCKLIELRDRGTMMPMLAIRPDGTDEAVPGIDSERSAARRYILGLCGWTGARPAVLLVRLGTGEGHFDPYDWPNERTLRASHLWLEENFDRIDDGQVVDVRVILGEASEPAVSGRLGG